MPYDLPPLVDELLARQHGVATSAQLFSRGLTPRRLGTATRRGVIVQPHRGAYALAESWEAAAASSQHCLRLLCVQLAAPDAVGVETTAATAWGWPVKDLPSLPIVARDLGAGRRLSGARVRRVVVDIEDVAHRHGLAVSSQQRTLADVVGRTPFVDALMTVDAALRTGVTEASVLGAVHDLYGRQRRAAVERSLAVGDPASESPLESTSRGHMIEAGLPMPLCNVIIRLGRRWYRVDFLWVELGVVGEADGRGKYDDNALASQVIWREKRREEQIEEWSFRVARWGFPEVADGPAPMLRRIRNAMAGQERAGFTWPAEVHVGVPVLGLVRHRPRVVAEVERLQRLGYPIAFSDERGRLLSASVIR